MQRFTSTRSINPKRSFDLIKVCNILAEINKQIMEPEIKQFVIDTIAKAINASLFNSFRMSDDSCRELKMDGSRNGLPVLAHSISARGYREFEREGIMAEFENKEQFSGSIDDMLNSIRNEEITRGKVINTAGRLFSFEQALNKINSIINQL